MRIYVLILDKAQSLDIHTVHDYMYVVLVSNPFVLALELADHPFWVHELSSAPSSATTPAARKYYLHVLRHICLYKTYLVFGYIGEIL